MNIYLCGFMGCGKSTVGRILAKELGYSFVDLDKYIIEKEGMSISEIFEKHGEKYFRKLEAASITAFKGQNVIIATGGGALVPTENALAARANGLIVFINTSFHICYDRISGDSSRPLTRTKSKAQLFELYKKRIPYYITHCDFEVDGNGSPTEIADEIKKLLPRT